jgi:hypothetical protein
MENRRGKDTEDDKNPNDKNTRSLVHTVYIYIYIYIDRAVVVLVEFEGITYSWADYS